MSQQIIDCTTDHDDGYLGRIDGISLVIRTVWQRRVHARVRRRSMEQCKRVTQDTGAAIDERESIAASILVIAVAPFGRS